MDDNKQNLNNIFRVDRIYKYIKDYINIHAFINIIINTRYLNCFVYINYFDISDDIKKFINMIFHFDHLIYKIDSQYQDIIKIMIKSRTSYFLLEYKYEFTMNKFNNKFEDVYSISILEYETLTDLFYNFDIYTIKSIIDKSKTIGSYKFYDNNYLIPNISEFYKLYIM
jgi:hypothetical protein